MNKWGILRGVIFFVGQILTIRWIQRHPDRADRYHEHFYIPLSGLLRKTFKNVPFSVGDVLYLSLVAGAIFLLIGTVMKYRHGIRRNGWRILYRGLIFVNLSYFTFQLFWGINYYKHSLKSRLNFEKVTPSKETLETVADLLLGKCIRLRNDLPEDKEGVFHLDQGRERLAQLAQRGFTALDQVLPHTESHDVSFKASLFSEAIAYLGISGYYNPFSGEAQVNIGLPSVRLLSTAMHEMSHQLGFSPESEASFYGFLAAASTGDRAFEYSAYYTALAHILQRLFIADQKEFEKYSKKLTLQLKRDFDADRKYSESHRSPLNMLGKKMNDLFLKSNGQKQGIYSYKGLTELLIAQYETEKKGKAPIRVLLNEPELTSE